MLVDPLANGWTNMAPHPEQLKQLNQLSQLEQLIQLTPLGPNWAQIVSNWIRIQYGVHFGPPQTGGPFWSPP